MTSKPLLRSLKVRGWRSFPTEGKVGQLDQLSQINILAGPNNAGKSNYLRLLMWLRDMRVEIGENPFPFGIEETQTWKLQNGPVRIWLSIDPESDKDFAAACTPFLDDGGQVTFYLDAADTKHGYRCDGTILLPDGRPHLFTDKNGQRAVRPGKGQALVNDASGRESRNALLNAVQPVRLLFQLLKQRVFDLQPVRSDDTVQGHNITVSSDGTNTIQRWRELGKDTKRRSYLSIRRDLHRVLPRWLGVSRATIDLGSSDLKIEFSDSYSAPLIELGSGVTELVLQFLFILLQRETLGPNIPFTMLIDEPESHLHPAIAFDFVKTVADIVPECQLIVTSHAPVLLDGLSSPQWRAYRIRKSDDGATHTSSILETTEKRTCCRARWLMA
ncbi:MAG: ATP-binding protein [Rhodoglobus sp.]|nr:ATP-binding protein [Rhodoglobus sp.]